MVPGEILEEIFAYLSRDALDHYAIICLKWSKVIETSKRLSQHRVVSLDYNKRYSDDDPNNRFWMELKSPLGKTIRIEDDPNQQELPASSVFTNIIIDELAEPYNINIDVLENRWLKIIKLAGAKIIVKRVYVRFGEESLRDNTVLKRLHDFIPKYIDVDEIEMVLITLPEDAVLFDRESWKYFDFGKKTKFNLNYYSNISPDNFAPDTFKEFISGKYMEHSNLNDLGIYLYGIDGHIIFHLIFEAFCNTDEPLKFFKSIKTFSINNLDEILDEFGFVRNDMDHQKYLLPHPKLKWILEATQLPDRYLKFKSIEL